MPVASCRVRMIVTCQMGDTGGRRIDWVRIQHAFGTANHGTTPTAPRQRWTSAASDTGAAMATAMNEIPTRAQIAIEDTWDLSRMYPDDEAWQAAATEIPELIEKAASYQGRLGEGPAVVGEALQAVNTLQERLYMLVVYASLRRDEDTTNTEANARYEQAIALSIGASQALAYVQPELLALEPERFQELATADELSTYAHMFDDLDRQREHVRSQEVEEVLAQMAGVTRTAPGACNARDNGDRESGGGSDRDGNKTAF